MRRPEPRRVRSFVGVLLPDAVRVRLDAAVAELRAPDRGIAWVQPENWHLTLRFLGSVDEATLDRAREALEAATATATAFRVTLGGLGGFPSARAPRVIWAGATEGGGALVALHGRLEAALVARGIAAEGRAFHPHVTLGRVRDTRGPGGGGDLSRILETSRAAFGEVTVGAVHLMRSDLGSGGARYSVLAASLLRGQ